VHVQINGEGHALSIPAKHVIKRPPPRRRRCGRRQGSSLLLGEREVVVASRPEAARFPVGTTIRSALHSTRVVDSDTATG
jgi:hypothetical protein